MDAISSHESQPLQQSVLSPHIREQLRAGGDFFHLACANFYFFGKSCGMICAGRARVVIKLALRVRAIRT
jgi:hypothetical protein